MRFFLGFMLRNAALPTNNAIIDVLLPPKGWDVVACFVGDKPSDPLSLERIEVDMTKLRRNLDELHIV
jgi:hypothetical protein